jgi:hypothetical protein
MSMVSHGVSSTGFFLSPPTKANSWCRANPELIALIAAIESNGSMPIAIAIGIGSFAAS